LAFRTELIRIQFDWKSATTHSDAGCNQFHQHFTSSFQQVNILSPKKSQSQTVIREKLRKALLYKKGRPYKSSRKMTMKLTPVRRWRRCWGRRLQRGRWGQDRFRWVWSLFQQQIIQSQFQKSQIYSYLPICFSSCSQFHQHFTSRFCADILSP